MASICNFIPSPRSPMLSLWPQQFNHRSKPFDFIHRSLRNYGIYFSCSSVSLLGTKIKLTRKRLRITFMSKVLQGPHLQRALLIGMAGVFNNINALLQTPRAASLPWLHCLEDYSFFTEHLVGSDGRENLSAPLAAVRWNKKCESLCLSVRFCP